MAPGRPLRRATHLFRQQDGPRGRQFLPLCRHDRRTARCDAAGHPASGRHRGGLHRYCRSGHYARRHLGRRNARCQFHDADIPANLVELAAEYRTKLVEAAVELDDDVLEAYLGGDEPDAATLNRCIRKGTIEGNFVPVLNGSAFKNKGVQPLLDAVVAFLPSPADVPRWLARVSTATSRSSVFRATTSHFRRSPSRWSTIRLSAR